MIGRLLGILWLLLVWLALLETVTPGAVVAGLVVATLLTLAFPGDRDRAGWTLRPLRLLALVGYFLAKLVQANVQVALAVVHPAPERVRRAIVAVPVVSRSRITRALLANAVSLTPGTFIVDIDERGRRIFVHVLDMPTPDVVRRDIHRMERMIVAALGPTDEREELESRIAGLTTSIEEGGTTWRS